MAYSSNQDLLNDLSEDLLMQLTDDYGAGVVDWNVVEEKRCDADALIDGYCASGYPLPFNPVPRVIRKLSRDITVYNLYDRRLGAPENVQRAYDNAIKLLGKIQAGDVELGADSSERAVDAGITTVSAHQEFTHRRLKEF
jgi:phage gp36-like protein